ncbi:uncharacterized protein LOC110927205 isoform X3 [Helianthus annuus]|uniref:uncharacterized protein LOC110927205 isoform X3 n=1 Tax=Helianthus annuus TaxID=4232 RepID=UPI000B8F1C0F|nr:uncharacterized protein LOC110927205 isoform X3 [Helianthus annuus]
MSQTGKLMHNLDQNSTKILNLTVLERMDPYIEEILITAAHVTFYEFNIDLNQWQIMDQKTWLWKKRYAKKSIDANSESENEAELVTTFSAENVHYITSKRFGSMQTTTTAGSDEPLKLALAMALLRSKLVNKTSETSHPPSDTSSSEALKWKRKEFQDRAWILIFTTHSLLRVPQSLLFKPQCSKTKPERCKNLPS